MTENDELRERLSLFELSLAMESYAVAPPDSLTAQIQTQLRAAALEVWPSVAAAAHRAVP